MNNRKIRNDFRKVCLAVVMLLTLSIQAQTLNVVVGDVVYQFPSSQTGDMTYQEGTTLTIMGKVFTLTDITKMYVDETAVKDNEVSIIYDDSKANVWVAGNVAQYVNPVVNGAHVTIAQSDDVNADNVGEITYVLSGNSNDGEFILSGSYKTTIELNGLTLTNPSGAAMDIKNGKRVAISVKKDTENTLTDGTDGSQKGCIVVKGHTELKGKGTLNVYGRMKHGIKSGEYLSMKNCTVNVLTAIGDGIHCAEYFLMESGTLNISGVGDDGIQTELDGTTSTGETTDHEDEDSGNIYIEDGTITVSVTANAAKGINADGDIYVKGGSITATTSGGGVWDAATTSDETSKTKASACIGYDGNMTISGGTFNLTSTGGGGKGINGDGALTINGGKLIVKTTGGTCVYSNNVINNNYTGNLDRIDSNYRSSPKGLKVDGALTISDGDINVSVDNSEGIETKSTLTISGGHVYSNASDDAINSSSHTTIEGGYVCAYSTGNDGMDANGNCYIKGGVVYAIGSKSPEVGIDANTEQQYKLYVQGGTLVAIGGLERGSSLTQTCYQPKTSSNQGGGGGGGWPPGGGGPGGGSGGNEQQTWEANKWYALYDGGQLALAFQTPASGGPALVVSTASTPTLKKGVSVNGGTEYFSGMANIGGTVNGGEDVSLEQYTSSGGGGGW